MLPFSSLAGLTIREIPESVAAGLMQAARSEPPWWPACALYHISLKAFKSSRSSGKFS